MSEDGGGGEQLAQWLKEAGRRTLAKVPLAAGAGDGGFNSPASLHQYLEELAGRRLRTHAEVLHYLREVAGTQPDAHHEAERRRLVREVSLLVLLTISYLHFYYWEVQLEIASLHSVGVFVTTPEARPYRT